MKAYDVSFSLGDGLRQAVGLGHRHRAAAVGQAVVAAALVVERGIGARAALHDQPVLRQPPDDRVERARAELHLAVGAARHLLDDGVAVLLAVGQGHQHLEHRRREGEMDGGIEAHGPTIPDTDRVSSTQV